MTCIVTDVEWRSFDVGIRLERNHLSLVAFGPTLVIFSLQLPKFS